MHNFGKIYNVRLNGQNTSIEIVNEEEVIVDGIVRTPSNIMIESLVDEIDRLREDLCICMDKIRSANKVLGNAKIHLYDAEELIQGEFENNDKGIE